MSRRLFVRFLHFIALVLLCIFTIRLEARAIQVISAPLTSRGGSTNGMVRVSLSSLGSPTTLTLTTAGQYSINGNTTQSLSNGESITVSFNSTTGTMVLTRGGNQTSMGSYFALKRHTTTGSNGIRIAQARHNNPYPGDISFQAVRQNNGSYKLQTVAHIYIENYLYGVLPYEMGNSSHIEALKAQAVAARTYTVRMMQSRASGSYDVVDTTSDQVYYGTPTGNNNCVKAIDDTKGIVLMNGSVYTATYYSASNGGQTESIANAWGTTGYDYLGVKDDPFDLANPDSRVKTTTISASLGTGGVNTSLLALLKTKVINELIKAGYSATASNTTLQTVKSITPHTPKFAAPSKLYTKLDFTISAITKGRNGETVTVSVTVTCDIFSEIENLLSMSIQSSANELWSVRKNGGNFVLEARRFGHGIGLSQRGAMYMGKQGYTYDKILGFYYPDCRRERISFTNTILSGSSSDLVTSIEDPAQIDEGIASNAIVQLVGSSSQLAIRAQKSLSSQILGVVSHNSPVTIYSNDGTWSFVRFGAIQGYVPSNALSIHGSIPVLAEEIVSAIQGFATVTANSFLNLRASGNTSAEVITTAPKGSVLTVFSTNAGWAHVQFGATAAYASIDFLNISSTYPGTFADSGSLAAVVFLEDSSDSLNLRASASTSSAIIAQIPHGTSLTVLRDDGSWSTVLYDGKTGYVISAFLHYEGNSSGTSDSSELTGNESEEGNNGAGLAVVNSNMAYIYQQKNESSIVIMSVAYGQSVVIRSYGSTWCAVRYEGIEGYMLTSSLLYTGGEGSNTDDAEIATVATKQGSLNLRAGPNAGSIILATIPRGAQLNVNMRGETWSAVTYHQLSGYVMTMYLQFANGTDQNELFEGTYTAVVTTTSGSLNLRLQPQIGSEILRTIPRNAYLSVLQHGLEWCNVTYQNTTGYVMTAFLSFVDGEGINPESTEENVTDEPDNFPNNVSDGSVQLYAMVTTASGSLNLRQEALLGSPVLATIPQGAILVISLKQTEWSLTTYLGRRGYVMNAYLTFLEEQPEYNPQDSQTAIVTTISGWLNLRASASLNASVLAAIPRYANVTVHSYGNQWCHVSYNGRSGYVMTQFLTLSSRNENDSGMSTFSTDTFFESATPAPLFEEDASFFAYSSAYVNTPSGGLNLRENADSQSAILCTIPRNETVEIIDYGMEWCQVQYGTLSGFVVTDFLRFENHIAEYPTHQPTIPAPIPAPTTSVDMNALIVNSQEAWVNTPSGDLNLRALPSMESDIVYTIPRYARLYVLASEGAWAQVAFDERIGFVLSSYLVYEFPTTKENESFSEPMHSIPEAHDNLFVGE